MINIFKIQYVKMNSFNNTKLAHSLIFQKFPNYLIILLLFILLFYDSFYDYTSIKQHHCYFAFQFNHKHYLDVHLSMKDII